MLEWVLDGRDGVFFANSPFRLFLSALETGAVPVGPSADGIEMPGWMLPLEVVVEEEPLLSPSRLL